MSGHPFYRRLSNEEMLRVKEMSKAGVAPHQVLVALKQANPESKVISKTVYNAKAKIREAELDGRTPIQALMEELSRGGFLYDFKYDGDNRLTHLFFAHPSSVTLSSSYSNVFVMDCTYKTNRFKMPLLDIIRISSFNTSFYSCFAFLAKEEEVDYVWALDRFKKVLDISEPTVIVSDRELALMNAIKIVFPRTINLICLWHVEKNILANCKGYFKEDEDWEAFLLEWTNVSQSDSQLLFDEAWNKFQNSYREKDNAIKYIEKTWLPFKEHFVRAWTDMHLHFGNRVTSSAEGSHAVLKSYLYTSTNDLHVVAEKICHAVNNNFHEIKTRLASEKIKIPHSICSPFFKELAYSVSHFVLGKLFQQYKLASSNSSLPACKGQFIATMGLPCAHMMRNMGRVLHLSDIHSQWQINMRSFEESSIRIENGRDKFKQLLQELEDNYEEWPISQKESTQTQLSQLLNSPLPVLFDPSIRSHRGRPSKSRSNKASSSTRRDPSAFEMVERSRPKCSLCNEVGHNVRTCPKKSSGSGPTTHFIVPTLVESGTSLGPPDLNSFPEDADHFLWE